METGVALFLEVKFQIWHCLTDHSMVKFNCRGDVCPFDGTPDRKKYSLLRDKYFNKDSKIRYLHSKLLNMRSE